MKIKHTITIELPNGNLCLDTEDGVTIGLHWRPLDRHDPYYNGPVAEETVQATLSDNRIWIDNKEEILPVVERAVAAVRKAAKEFK